MIGGNIKHIDIIMPIDTNPTYFKNIRQLRNSAYNAHAPGTNIAQCNGPEINKNTVNNGIIFHFSLSIASKFHGIRPISATQ
jgi:hypothetical protein